MSESKTLPRFWALECSNDTPGVYLEREDLLSTLNKDGLDTNTVRRTFLSAFGGRPVPLRLTDGQRVLDQPPDRDAYFWSWLPVFSQRAQALILQAGGEAADFLPCRLGSHAELYALHLPLRSFDVVDVPNSRFGMILPLSPPLPHHILHLAFAKVRSQLPQVFRALVPGHSQVFNELICQESFRTSWDGLNLTGASFRSLGSGELFGSSR